MALGTVTHAGQIFFDPRLREDVIFSTDLIKPEDAAAMGPDGAAAVARSVFSAKELAPFLNEINEVRAQKITLANKVLEDFSLLKNATRLKKLKLICMTIGVALLGVTTFVIAFAFGVGVGLLLNLLAPLISPAAFLILYMFTTAGSSILAGIWGTTIFNLCGKLYQYSSQSIEKTANLARLKTNFEASQRRWGGTPQEVRIFLPFLARLNDPKVASFIASLFLNRLINGKFNKDTDSGLKVGEVFERAATINDDAACFLKPEVLEKIAKQDNTEDKAYIMEHLVEIINRFDSWQQRKAVISNMMQSNDMPNNGMPNVLAELGLSYL